MWLHLEEILQIQNPKKRLRLGYLKLRAPLLRLPFSAECLHFVDDLLIIFFKYKEEKGVTDPFER